MKRSFKLAALGAICTFICAGCYVEDREPSTTIVKPPDNNTTVINPPSPGSRTEIRVDPPTTGGTGSTTTTTTGG